MSSTTISTITYPCPPPTTNTLDSIQRMRLIRSARKLEAVMGTTPYFLEQDFPVTLLPIGGNKVSPTHKKLKRQGSIFTHCPSVSSFSSSSSTSLHSQSPSLVSLPLSMRSTESLVPSSPGPQPTRSRKTPDKSRQLYLRLNTVPLSPTDRRCASLPTTPGSSYSAPSPSFPPTPNTPCFDPAEVRRKRITKLARYLGETVPPELVTVHSPMQSPTSHEPITPLSPNTKLHAHKRADSEWVGEWNRHDIRDVRKELRALKVKLPSWF